MSRWLCAAATMLSVLALGLLSPTQAEIPQVISYQGKVTDTSGNPVADGSYTMRFRIYDAVTSGTLKWDSGDCSVAVAGGVFSVLLGESPQPALALDFDQDYWLDITVDGDPQSPRVKMGSAGYAYMASGLVAGTEVSGEVVTGTSAAIKGTNTAPSGAAYGVHGSSASTAGYGVLGTATASTGAAHGVYGSTNSSHGHAVHASNPQGAGVWAEGKNAIVGLSETPGYGAIFGSNTATSGAGMGVYGSCYSSTGYGVYGINFATTGYPYGVMGRATSGVGRGVEGLAEGTAGIGVVGFATATTGATYALFGGNSSTGGTGVYAAADATTGTTYGVYAVSNSTAGTAVYGYASATFGTTSNSGGRFETSSASGGRGCWGRALAASGVCYGVYGQAGSAAGYGVWYSGGIGGTGLIRAVVKTSRGPTSLDALTAAGCWVEDFGEGRLVNGRCRIELDHLFLETVTIDAANPMKVFVQLKGDCRGVYVQDGLSGFDVVELQGGTSSVPLTYRVVAKRRGFEAKRLDVCEAARTDSYLYPELREKELQEDAAERAKMEERRVRQEDERVRMAQEDVRMREAPAAREALPEIGSRKLVAEGR